jgi:plasmid stabilization system protein ParE
MEGAARGLERCRRSLSEKSSEAAIRAAQAISTSFDKLETLPDIGKPLPNNLNFRELIINFGDSGYVALYRHDCEQDAVYIIAFRHQKEAGY